MRILHEFSPGDVFNGRYRLSNLVGTGGFAEVWKAFDTFTSQELAIKIYANLDDDGRKQLTAEYSRVQALSHPNILKAEHFDISDDRPYLTMRYCAGGSLESQIGEMSAIDMAWVVRDIMSALSYLHTNGIVHQDIKPANILIDTSGSRPHYILCDFGISATTRSSMNRSIEDKDSQPLYMTTFYAPPEKFSSVKADRKPFAEGDIFSLGVTLLELTGTLRGVEKSLGAEMMRGSGIEVNYNVLPSKPLQVMVQQMLNYDMRERGTAQLFYEWAVNIIERMPQQERMKVKRIDLLNERQESRLIDVESDRRKSVLVKHPFGQNNPRQVHQKPQVHKVELPDDDVEDIVLDFEEDDVRNPQSENDAEMEFVQANVDDAKPNKSQKVRGDKEEDTDIVTHIDLPDASTLPPQRPKKIDIEEDDDADEDSNDVSYVSSSVYQSNTGPRVVTPQAEKKKSSAWLTFLYIVIIPVLLGAAYGVYHTLSNNDTTENTYIPDSDINFVQAQVPRLQNRVATFSNTQFYVKGDYDQMYNNISSEIDYTLNKCHEILGSSDLPDYKRNEIEQNQQQLEDMKTTMSNMYYQEGMSQK